MIIGIDPAYSKPNAYAFYQAGKITDYGLFSDFRKYEELLKEADLVGIEEQYFSKDVNNHDTLKKLSRVVGVLIFLAERNNVPVKLIYPSSWMSSIGIAKNIKRGKVRDEWIKRLAKGLVGKQVKKINIDEACAINIAAFTARRYAGLKK